MRLTEGSVCTVVMMRLVASISDLTAAAAVDGGLVDW